jgi:hypothetical protein
MIDSGTVLLAAAKPAGGAALDQVVGATAGAAVVTAALLWAGLAHRRGRGHLLRRAAAVAERHTGLPGWAALPVQLASVSLLVALLGMYWDISLHIDRGRDEGPLANPAHYLILVGLYGIFAAGFVSMVLSEGRPSRAALRVTRDWYVPIGGVALLACSAFSLTGFPLDDVWHRLFGQDVTLWGPTHLMLIGGAGLTLLGQAALIVEGQGARRRTGASVPSARGMLAWLGGTRIAAISGGLLIGLSTFQAEFDFGVPQFRLVFQPMLIALAAGGALVTARLLAGRGGAVVAVAWFLAIRGLVSLLVGPVLGETTPHIPLYLAEAVLVELAAWRLGTRRPYVLGAVAGALAGTAGFAAEWAWSHVWMPHPWTTPLLPEALVAATVAGIAGGVLGAYAGGMLRAAGRRDLAPPTVLPAAGALAVLIVLVGWALDTRSQSGVRATITAGPPLTVRFDPPGAADGAEWVTVTAWQGGGFVLDHLQRTGDGTYRATRPVPLDGDWKTIVRLHKGKAVDGVPVYLPADAAIPAPEVPVRAHVTRPLVRDVSILQRERKDGVAGWITAAAYAAVLAIALAFLLGIGWALRRLALAEAAPPRAGGRFRRGSQAEAERIVA